MLIQKLSQISLVHTPFAADLDCRDQAAPDHFSDLLTAGLQQRGGLFHCQKIDHAHGSSSQAR